jgi:hypothetical protein
VSTKKYPSGNYARIDKAVNAALKSTLEEGARLRDIIHFIVDKLGEDKGRIHKRRRQFESVYLKIIEDRSHWGRDQLAVYYADKLRFKAETWRDAPAIFRPGPWTTELEWLYLQARLRDAKDRYGLEDIAGICINRPWKNGECKHPVPHSNCPCEQIEVGVGEGKKATA